MKRTPLSTALGAAAAAALLLAGCGSAPERSAGPPPCGFPDSPQHAAPLWVCGAPVPGHPVTAVGSGSSEGRAEDDAHARLLPQMRAYMAGLVTQYAEATGAASGPVLARVVASVAAQVDEDTIDDADELEDVESPGGIDYVLVGIATDDVMEQAEEVLLASMKREPSVWQGFAGAADPKERVSDILKLNQQRAR